jgi:hypothetical protein
MIRRLFNLLTDNRCVPSYSSPNRRNRRPVNFEWNKLGERRLLAADGGWVGNYYQNGVPDATPAHVQHEALINFDWGEKSFLDNVNDSDGSSARWESNLRSDHSATHQLIFRMNADDGLKVWVDNQVVIDAWDGAGADELVADVALVADQSTPIPSGLVETSIKTSPNPKRCTPNFTTAVLVRHGASFSSTSVRPRPLTTTARPK